MKKNIKIGQYLQKLLQKVYGQVFYAPQCTCHFSEVGREEWKQVFRHGWEWEQNTK